MPVQLQHLSGMATAPAITCQRNLDRLRMEDSALCHSPQAALTSLALLKPIHILSLRTNSSTIS